MARILGGTLIVCLRDLEWAINIYGSDPEEGLSKLAQAIRGISEEAVKVPLGQTYLHQIQRLQRYIDHPLPPEGMMLLASEAREGLIAEMMQCLMVVVPARRRAHYHEDDLPLFGTEVDRAFPDTPGEIAEAGRCFALARWTACVFHLMRACEKALHKWSDGLGVPLKVPAEQANWQEILNASTSQIKAIEQKPKSPQRDADLGYFSETAAHFMAIKNAWRNHVAHSKVTYNEGQAETIMDHVRAFMQILASRQ